LPSPLPEVGKFTAGPPGTADAGLARDNDKPAAPSTGKALLRRFRFEDCFVWDMSVLHHSKERSFLGLNIAGNCFFLGQVPIAIVQSAFVARRLAECEKPASDGAFKPAKTRAAAEKAIDGMKECHA
jgi:hypothetical protein